MLSWYATKKKSLHNCFIRFTMPWKIQWPHDACDIRAQHDGKVGCNTVEYDCFPALWLAVSSMTRYKYLYYSIKIYPRFWLVKTTRIIHHNQLLLTKFEKKLCHIESMTSKVQPAANYWTDNVKNDVKSAAYHPIQEREKTPGFPGISSGMMSHWARRQTLPLSLWCLYILLFSFNFNVFLYVAKLRLNPGLNLG